MRQFSAEHVAALSAIAAGIGLSVLIARGHPGRPTRLISVALALTILAGWIGEYVADVAQGTWTVRYDLPLQLTDAVSVVAVLALATRRRLLVELTYFWALTASLQATLTPDLAESFPSVFYFTYLGYHGGAIVAACFLVFGCGLYPRPGSAWRVFAVTLAFTALAGVGDAVTGGNYMYLRAKPAHWSLLTLLGPRPWYIVAAAALGLAMLLAVEGLTALVRPRPATPPARSPRRA